MHYESRNKARKGFIFLAVTGLILLAFISSRHDFDQRTLILMPYKLQEQPPANSKRPLKDSMVVEDANQMQQSTIKSDIAKEIAQCKERFNVSLEDNLKVIEHYPSGIADQYITQITRNRSSPDVILQTPVFVTAFNAPYFWRAGDLFHNLHNVVYKDKRRPRNMIVIAYDLGLRPWQVEKVKKKCRCIVRKFPFENYPAHVKDLRTYAFKPIIVQQVLMEFGFVWWVDTSVRFTTGYLTPAVLYAWKHSILFSVSTAERGVYSITKQTDQRTFQFLGEDSCKFRPFSESWATSLIFHFDNVTNIIVKAWANCALNRDCIAPVGTNKKIFCKVKQTFDGRCHRFDQSIISILSRRLHHDVDKYPGDRRLRDMYQITRGQDTYYF